MYCMHPTWPVIFSRFVLQHSMAMWSSLVSQSVGFQIPRTIWSVPYWFSARPNECIGLSSGILASLTDGASTGSQMFDLWHQRLGHCCSKRLKNAVNQKLVEGVDISALQLPSANSAMSNCHSVMDVLREKCVESLQDPRWNQVQKVVGTCPQQCVWSNKKSIN